MFKCMEYSMRPIEKSDLPIVFQWRNSERVHSMMLTDHKIDWDEHRKWFRSIETGDIIRNFIFQYQDTPIGYIGYSDIDQLNRRCSTGAYLGEFKNLPVDAGVMLIYMSIEYSFEVLNFNKIWSYVFSKNKSAHKVDCFLGYKEEGFLKQHFFKNGEFIDVYVLGLLRNDWPTRKEIFQSLLGSEMK